MRLFLSKITAKYQENKVISIVNVERELGGIWY